VSEYRLDGRRYFTGIVRDITERRMLERRLRERADQLAKEERRKDEFLATLAHELRNPLAPIHNAVQVLMTLGSPDPELRWCRDVIDRHVRHMARLLDDLLDVSRISHGKLELRKERIPLAAVVQSAVETSRPLIEGRHHELVVEVPAEPIYLEADPVRLAQVFSNLLNNAARYTEAGGHIRLSAEREGAEVAVRVKDDGIGISAGMMPHIFEIFSQAPEGMERSQGGLGVGLSLVRRLVQLHGGRIATKSAGRNQGSEFTVHLPVVVKPLAPAARREAVEPIARRRLLIVDDVKDAADSLAHLMRLKGHEVRAAYDGGAAIAAAAEFRPEVVLLDIGMPNLDGYETCRTIREQSWGKGMFLVALTGWGQEGDRRRAEEAGFNQHLVKPVDPAAFAALLAALPVSQAAQT
jgi:CheY-like chemotaxis protein